MLYPKYFSKERMYSQLIKGNRFHITIRGITQSPSAIKKHVTNTHKEIEKMGGVPNFFGHQRFGTIRPNTHIIGKYLTILKKQTDGSWKIYRDCFNSDVPPKQE